MGKTVTISEPFTFEVADDSTLDVAQFKLQLQAGQEYQWEEFLEIPVHREVSIIEDFVIADGSEFRVATAGDDTTSMILGHGNGDGIANPGESFVVLIPHNGIYYRTQLYFNDTNLNPKGINIRKSDTWGSYDHVGGSAKYSVPLVASDCPPGSSIELLAEYWLPDYPYHIIRKGKISITVIGHDQTPPVIRWVDLRADNTLQVKLHDGDAIESVKVRLVNEKETDQVKEFSLNDQGTSGDGVAGDQVFSYQIPQTQFGLYKIQITASDHSGNGTVNNWPGSFVVR